MTDKERLLILNMIDEIGGVRLQNLLRHFGSVEEIFKADKKALEEVENIGPGIATRLFDSIRTIDIRRELELIEKHNIKVLTFLDKEYPENLKNIHSPPIVLYIKGAIHPEDKFAISIVGSRMASIYGLQQAERLAFELASHGLTIVSGLARGIDSSSHRGALKAKGRTIAVLGSGLANIYPEEHISLTEEISQNGAVISEFPMSTIPARGNFPRRNRIISGLSLGVVVVEASEKSGALITVDFALEQGKDVFAVPGKVDSITSRGTNRLIKQGARLVESSKDILDELKVRCPNNKGDFELSEVSLEKPETQLLDKGEALVYNLLSDEPKHIDELSEATGMNIGQLSQVLFSLELKRFARQLPGKNFVKV